MDATAKILQVGEEFLRGHVGVKRDWFLQFSDSCVFNYCKNKVAGFAFGGSKEELIRNFSMCTALALVCTKFVALFKIILS